MWVKVLVGPITHDGVRYEEGATMECGKELSEYLASKSPPRVEKTRKPRAAKPKAEETEDEG